MREQFQADLSRLGRDLVDLAELVHRAMDDARQALRTADVHRAEQVISEDARIDQLQEQLDEQAVQLLALQSPMASDLRTVVATLRMSSSLERMGDLARHIAQLTRLRYPEQVVPASVQPIFAAMSADAVEAAAHVVLLLESHDLSHADRIDEVNRLVNEHHLSVFRAIADQGWDEAGPTTTDITLASRYLERFTDHALSVSSKVRYLVTGEWASHSKEP